MLGFAEHLSILSILLLLLLLGIGRHFVQPSALTADAKHSAGLSSVLEIHSMKSTTY